MKIDDENRQSKKVNVNDKTPSESLRFRQKQGSYGEKCIRLMSYAYRYLIKLKSQIMSGGSV